MIREVVVGEVYLSRSGNRFIVKGFSRYGLNCSVPFVHYENLDPTFDREGGCSWVIEESLFLKMFREIEL